jgi:hypothetical protein
VRSIKTASPSDSWQYCSYSLEDLNAEPEDRWIIFSEDMSVGTFATEKDAREYNNEYLEWDWVNEYITVAEFKERLKVNPDLEMEPAG